MISLKKFEQSALAYRTEMYFGIVKTDYIMADILYRFNEKTLTIRIGSNTIAESAFNDYQIKTESGNVAINKTAYFRVFA